MSDDQTTPNDNSDSNSDSSEQRSSERRDPELARLFGAQSVPDHGASFWSDLSTQLRAETNGGPVATSVSDQTGADAGSQPDTDTDLGTTVIDLDQQRNDRRRRRSLVLSLAAAVLVVVASVGVFSALADRDTADNNTVADEGPDDTSQPDDPESMDEPVGTDDETGQAENEGNGETGTPDQRDSTDRPTIANPFPAIDYTKSVEVLNLGSGEAIGTTPDGSAILVVDQYLEQPAAGCEGAPLLMLYGQDVATGMRRPLLPEGMTVETGGLRFLFADFTRPLDGGQTDVFWTDFCDGVPNQTWLATMLPNGAITGPTAIESGSSEDPFGSGLVSSDAADGRISNDISYRLQQQDQTLGVQPTDSASDELWIYSEEMPSSWNAAFTPAGDAVVVNDGEQTVFWRYQTDDRFTIPTGEVATYRFGRSGEYVFLNYLSAEFSFAVLNFGDGPAPSVQTQSGCSGDTDLGELQTQDRLPPAVAETLAAIDAAAALCDWTALVSLTDDSFLLGFGGGTPSSDWPAAEAAGETPMRNLRMLLRSPVVKTGEGQDTAYVLPAISTKSCEEHTDEDRASLETLGYSDEQMAADCEIFGGYAGLRTRFSEAGDWLFLVSGD
ncbi:MAG: hypothetical protein ACRBK7_08350 [Acidimicrobiales bacterium]